MAGKQELSETFSFGDASFKEADRSLTRNGTRTYLRPKAAAVLVSLLRAQGEVVSKAALLEEVWPGTAVEENNLNQQIAALRVALGDHASREAYIATLHGLGYRIVPAVVVTQESGSPVPELVTETNQVAAAARIPTPVLEHPPATAPTDGCSSDAGQAPAQPAGVGHSGHAKARVTRLRAMALVALAVGVAGVAVRVHSERDRVEPTTPAVRVVNFRPIASALPAANLNWPLLVDEKRIYLEVNDRTATVPVTGGVIAYPSRLADYRLYDIRAPASRLLAARRHDAGADGALLSLPLDEGSAHRLGLTRSAEGAVWSPDGTRLAYAQGDSLYLARADGAAPTRLATEAGTPGWPRWSPDGRVLRYSVQYLSERTFRTELWEIRSDGTGRHRLLANWSDDIDVCCGSWAPDGRSYVFRATRAGRSDLWMLEEGLRARHGPEPPAMRLTAGPVSLFAPAFSSDGRRIFAVGHADRGELVRFEPRTKGFVPYLAGMSASWVTFTRDGKWVAYVSEPEKTLWRARSDGTEKRQLTSAPLLVDSVSWSPDGRTVACRMGLSENDKKIYLIAADGESVRPLTEGTVVQGMATWSRDGTRLAYGDVPERFGHATGSEAIHIADLKAHRSWTIPGSAGLWSPRWSSNGRFLAATTIELTRGQELMLYDFETSTWRSTGATHVSSPTWSRDSQYIYYVTDGGPSVLKRVRVKDGGIDILFDLAADDHPEVSTNDAWWWTGLSADDSPIVLRTPGGSQLYALELER